MATTCFNAKIGEVKIPDHSKYITTPEFNTFAGSVFDTKLKQAILAAGIDVNGVSQCANKNKDIIEKLKTFDLSCFLCKICLFVNQHLVR